MSSSPRTHDAHGYEARDAQPRWLIVAGLALVALIALSFVLVSGLDSAFERRDQRSAEPLHPMSTFRTPPTVAPLQAVPKVEYEAYAAERRALLSSYGWVDPSQDLVRMPVERAMELVVERGLPVRSPSVEDPR